MKNLRTFNVVPEILTGVGTFTSTNKQPPICSNERVKRVYTRRFLTFYLIVLHSFYFAVIQSYFTQGAVCRKMGRMNLSIVDKYFSVEVTHNLRIALIAPPNSFYVDFIHFKYCFQFSISAWNRLMFGLLFFIFSNFPLSNNCPSIIPLQYQCQSCYLATVFPCRVIVQQ